MVAHLAAAIERSTGLARIRVDVRMADEGPTRPAPPPVAGGSSDDAEGPSADEVAAVAEVATTSSGEPADAAAIDQLVRDELGAQPLPDDE